MLVTDSFCRNPLSSQVISNCAIMASRLETAVVIPYQVRSYQTVRLISRAVRCACSCRNPLSSQVISNLPVFGPSARPDGVVIPYQVRSYQTSSSISLSDNLSDVVIPYQVRSYQTSWPPEKLPVLSGQVVIPYQVRSYQTTRAWSLYHKTLMVGRNPLSSQVISNPAGYQKSHPQRVGGVVIPYQVRSYQTGIQSN